jgi:hypothetical protein
MMPKGARPGILAMLRGTHMTTTFQTSLTHETYNGWANYETWNVALWIGNDYGLYSIALQCEDYSEFVNAVEGLISETPDGVSFTSDELNWHELNDLIEEF